MTNVVTPKYAHILVHFTEEWREFVCDMNDFSDPYIMDDFIEQIAPEIQTYAILPLIEEFRNNNVSDMIKASGSLMTDPEKITFCFDNDASGNRIDFIDTPPTLIETGEPLDQLLKADNITHIICTGYIIDGCVLGHALDFNHRGFKTSIISDLTNGQTRQKDLFGDYPDEEPEYIDGYINPPRKTITAAGIDIITVKEFWDRKPQPHMGQTTQLLPGGPL